MVGQAEVAVRIHPEKAPHPALEEVSAAEAVRGWKHVDDHELIPFGGSCRLQVGDAIREN